MGVASSGSQASTTASVIVAGAVVAVSLTVANCRRHRKAAAHLSPAFARYPRQYIARRGTPPAIDGDVNKAVWHSAPWSEAFVEIRGEDDAPPGTSPNEAQTTRMKMLWDDEFLYIAAIMDVAVGDDFVAKFTERNSPIFHTDSDFEVFVDPAGCCHGYKELEMNAINTVWNLMLNRPYADGGSEISGRVARAGEPNFWEVQKQKTAARILRGALGDPSRPAQWCCEIALAHTDTLPGAPVRGPSPKVGSCWRINFSRVEKKGAVNWVWSPQIVWTPADNHYQGQVNMHLPDAWGYVVFADVQGKFEDLSDASTWRDPAWPARHAAMCVYYAVHAYRQRHRGELPRSTEELQSQQLLQESALAGCRVVISAASAGDEGTFEVEATSDEWTANVCHDRLLRVARKIK